MPLKRRDIENSLEAKGFKRVEGDHCRFIYYSIDGRKTTVRTMTSHGTGSKEIGDNLVSVMAKQCKLKPAEFRDLIGCPLGREAYEDKLVSQQFVDKIKA